MVACLGKCFGRVPAVADGAFMRSLESDGRLMQRRIWHTDDDDRTSCRVLEVSPLFGRMVSSSSAVGLILNGEALRGARLLALSADACMDSDCAERMFERAWTARDHGLADTGRKCLA